MNEQIRILTVEDAKGWHTREDAHYNGGAAFFAYLHRCVEQPRLTTYDRYERKNRSVTSTWRTDGVDQPNLEAAVAALNTPPSFSAAELQELAIVTSDYVDIRKAMKYELNHALVEKGAVEWSTGKCRLTAAGKSVLANSESRA